MGATKIEFRLRMVILVTVIFLGFWAPWIEVWGLARVLRCWSGWRSSWPRMGLLSFAAAARW